jgi:hypothetical protein
MSHSPHLCNPVQKCPNLVKNVQNPNAQKCPKMSKLFENYCQKWLYMSQLPIGKYVETCLKTAKNVKKYQKDWLHNSPKMPKYIEKVKTSKNVENWKNVKKICQKRPEMAKNVK